MESKTIRSVTCAWCNKPMGEKDGKGVSGVSHGICEACYDKITADTEIADNTRDHWRDMADFGALDAAADIRED